PHHNIPLALPHIAPTLPTPPPPPTPTPLPYTTLFRSHDPHHRLPPAGAVDPRRLLELARHALEVPHQEPRAERDEERRVRQHHRAERVAEAEPVDDLGHRDEQQRLRNEVGGRDADRQHRRAGE